MIYLTHPLHGTHIAYDAEEVKRCEANGWRVKPVIAAPTVVPAKDFHDSRPVEDVPVEEKRKPGRPKK